MITAAEQAGHIKPGDTLVEATAGNTGLGLALVAALKGYKLIIVMPDKMSAAKIRNLRCYGAEVIITRSDVCKGHPEYYQDLATSLVEGLDKAFYINQFANPANVAAHETGTAPEIWQQMEHQLDAVVCGVGTGGTLTGIGRFMQQHAPNVEMVLADPQGSILADEVNTGTHQEPGSWVVEGIGEDFIPDILDLKLVSEAITVSDKDALLTVRDILRKEGLMVGTSSGTLIHAALQYCRKQTTPKRVVSFVCDTGNKYLDKAFFDTWMINQNIFPAPSFGDLRDIILRTHQRHQVLTASPKETLAAIHTRMSEHNIQYIPILETAENTKQDATSAMHIPQNIIGLLDTNHLLKAVVDAPENWQQPAETFMDREFTIIPHTTPLTDVMSMLENTNAMLVSIDNELLGVLRRMDLINYLRRSARP